MTREEFQSDVGAYASKLWPKLILNPEQVEMWFHKLKAYSAFDARKVLGEAYASSKWKEPVLSDVVNLLKQTTRTNVKATHSFPSELVAQVAAEEREEREMLADWRPEDYENGKAEIIRKEPAMAAMEKLPARGGWWIHFLVERYIYFRAMIYSHDSWSEIDRDLYWANPAPVNGGLISVRKLKSGRAEAQQAKVDLNGLEET